MPSITKISRADPVAVARARVIRADGAEEIHYSIPKIPLSHVRRRLKLWRHLRFMRKEDQQ